MNFLRFFHKFRCSFFKNLFRGICRKDADTGIFSADGNTMDMMLCKNTAGSLILPAAVHFQKYGRLFFIQMDKNQSGGGSRPLQGGCAVFGFLLLGEFSGKQICKKLFIQFAFVVSGHLIAGIYLHVVFGLYDSDHDREYDFNKTCVVIQKKQGEIQFVCQFQCFFWKIVKKSGFDSESGWQELP